MLGHAAKADIGASTELKGQAAKEPDDNFTNTPDVWRYLLALVII